MKTLEISFSARVPYNSDDNHLNRNVNIEFDLDLSNPNEVIRQFNKFLTLNDIELQVAEA